MLYRKNIRLVFVQKYTNNLLNRSHALLISNCFTKSALLRVALGYNCILEILGDLNWGKKLKIKKPIFLLLLELSRAWL